MTTIAWDGITLAADRCSWSGGVRRTVSKLRRIKRGDRTIICAAAGNGAWCLRVIEWVKGEAAQPNPKDFDAPLDSACLVAVDERRRSWLLSNTLVWMPMRDRIFAFGAGQDVAWGALEAGATSKQAVEIAIKRSDYAGLGVDTLRFRG